MPKIISATDVDGNDLSAEQILEDLPELNRIHRQALEKEPMWEYFGGVIDIEDREYQVC